MYLQLNQAFHNIGKTLHGVIVVVVGAKMSCHSLAIFEPWSNKYKQTASLSAHFGLRRIAERLTLKDFYGCVSTTEISNIYGVLHRTLLE